MHYPYITPILFLCYPYIFTITSLQDYPYTQLAQWVFHATKPDSQKDISFSEYVHMVAYFVMLGHRELMKFLFQAVDTENKQFLRYSSRAMLCAIKPVFWAGVCVGK